MLKSPLAVTIVVVGALSILAAIFLALMALPATTYPYRPTDWGLIGLAASAAVSGLLMIGFGRLIDLVAEIRDHVFDPARAAAAAKAREEAEREAEEQDRKADPRAEVDAENRTNI